MKRFGLVLVLAALAGGVFADSFYVNDYLGNIYYCTINGLAIDGRSLDGRFKLGQRSRVENGSVIIQFADGSTKTLWKRNLQLVTPTSENYSEQRSTTFQPLQYVGQGAPAVPLTATDTVYGANGGALLYRPGAAAVDGVSGSIYTPPPTSPPYNVYAPVQEQAPAYTWPQSQVYTAPYAPLTASPYLPGAQRSSLVPGAEIGTFSYSPAQPEAAQTGQTAAPAVRVYPSYPTRVEVQPYTRTVITTEVSPMDVQTYGYGKK